MAIYSGFSHEKWWFSIAMLNYQRVAMIVWDAQEMTCTEQMDRAAQRPECCCRPHQATNGRETTDHETWKTSEDPFRIVIPKMKSITHHEKNCEETTPTIGQPLRAAWPSSGRHSDAFEKPQLFWLVVSHFFCKQKNPHNLKWWSSMTMTNMNQHD